METFATFKLFFLGCRVNQYEIQSYRSRLLSLGLIEIEDEKVPADLCVINTCAVTCSAEGTSRNTVRRVLKNNPEARVVVTGCYVEADRNFFSGLERCTTVPNSSKEDLVGLLFNDTQKILPDLRSIKDRSRVFIKVQDGCNSFCSYCIIPYLRGRSVSRDYRDILEEIAAVASNGYGEVVITGINVGDYRFEDWDLADLVRGVDSIEGLSRIRISSIDPEDISEDLAEVILQGQRICPSLHLVLQSGSNGILKVMNRKYSRADFLDKVDRLRSVNPNFAFSTDVIVGFPGETDADFEDTLNMIRYVGFTKVHIFPYSPRKRTKAYTFAGKIPDHVMKERKRLIKETADKSAMKVRERFVGSRTEVLTETVQSGICSGHNPEFIKVMFSGKVSPGRIVSVLIKENTTEGLIGVMS